MARDRTQIDSSGLVFHYLPVLYFLIFSLDVGSSLRLLDLSCDGNGRIRKRRQDGSMNWSLLTLAGDHYYALLTC